MTQTVIAEYGYDPFGRRLWKEVGGTSTYFFYADEGLVAEYDHYGTERRSYGWQPDSTWDTHPLWLKQNGEYYWYQNDHLGTPQQFIDTAGMVVWLAHIFHTFLLTFVKSMQSLNNMRRYSEMASHETDVSITFFTL